MRFLVVEHERDSGIGFLGERAEARGDVITVVRPTEEPLPATTDGFDGLVVLGAAPSVNDPDISGWFAPEIGLIRAAVAADVAVLGVCFGAQALAVALGGTVARASRPEVGWHEIESDDLDAYPVGPWFQWHVDAITPPPGAVVMARSAVCAQAFEVGRHMAVQFHPEAGEDQARDWAAGDPSGLAASGRSAEQLLEESRRNGPGARARASALWDRYAERCAQAGIASNRLAAAAARRAAARR